MKSFLIFEICVSAVFIITLWHSVRRTPFHRAELFTAFAYAILFEEIDMMLFKTYHYGNGYTFVIGNVPVVIALAWSIIIYTGMHISDAYGMPEFIKPFFDSLLAVLIDLSVDAIAIRLGYWQWEIPLNEGWFGAPAGNLYAWMFVVFFFSLFCRVIREISEKKKAYLSLITIVPFLSYAGLFAGIAAVNEVNVFFNFDEDRKLITFFTISALFMLVIFINSRPKGKYINSDIHPVIYFIRICLHSFFLLELIFNRLYIQTPPLAVVAVCALLIEISIHKKASM